MRVSLKHVNGKVLSVFLILGLLSACSNKSSEESLSSQVIATESPGENVVKSTYNINTYPLNKLVCDPFDNTPAASPKNGIKSSLWFRGFGQPIYTKVMDYIDKTRKSEQTLFFNSINVPTRLFYNGFPLETGDVVRDDLGTQLIEYFAMKFETQITLADNDDEGTYELAVLSDDGTILKIKEPNVQGVLPTEWETHINNDGDTPTRMKCSTRTINMTRGKKIPAELSYYQGPRYHIANMLIWRKTTTAGQDTLCNQSGNGLFFDPNHNSAPLKWNDLVSRGWKAVGANNYLLPESTDANNTDGDSNYNACYQGQVPVITQFQMVEQLATDISFAWKTDIPATAQILVVNLDTGDKTVTQTDNVLRTNHSVIISGLKPNTRYRFQAVAISADLGRGISEAIETTTF